MKVTEHIRRAAGKTLFSIEVLPPLKGENIRIRVDIGARGKGAATVWTCDLTKEYVAINGDYRS